MYEQKPNFQRETDRIINALTEQGKRETLLLHACCAPCASYVLEYLTQSFEISVFFSNPNITSREEYQKRLSELRRFVSEAPFCEGVTVIEDPYDPELFFSAARGLEGAPEGGTRCEKCFSLRLSRTAEYAKAHGFSWFATTLTLSPYKNPPLINRIGSELEKQTGVLYLPSDFKKRGGYQRSIVLSREYHLYRQNYCGCVFSRRGAAPAEPPSPSSEEQ